MAKLHNDDVKNNSGNENKTTSSTYSSVVDLLNISYPKDISTAQRQC